MSMVSARLWRRARLAGGTLVVATGAALAAVSPAQQAILDRYLADARKADAAFTAGSGERGKAFYLARHAGGKPDTPSCTSCHTPDPTKTGKTRAGKDIAPMAASANPKRFTDAADVEKWFKRNCSDVLGRECTAPEKVDVMTYLLGL